MRTSGILLPISSLPNKYGIGCFSKEAYEFVDFLAEAKQTYWQILPIGPTSYGDSPYQSFSTYAGNPYFIDLTELIRQGLLTEEECDAVDFGKDDTSVDYEKLYLGRFDLLRKAFERSEMDKNADFTAFCQKNKEWLEDYAAYMAIKNHFGGKSFVEWPDDIRLRQEDAMEEYCDKLQSDIAFFKYIQFEFYRQWNKLKSYANGKGVFIIGDIPIYVAPDSADVWASPELFQMEEGALSAVAGCPPDGFSATGQLWGNPLYDWDYHKKTGFAWWIGRIAHCSKMYDVIRIDHFRAFDQYYSIPADEETAVNGEWVDGPGFELFRAMKDKLGQLHIIAEDLGYMTDSVRKLVADTAFPNMKVLQFAFDARDSSGPSEYLPHNYPTNCVVYTGTHDNETTCGWLGSITEAEYQLVQDYLGMPGADDKALCKGLIRAAQSSVADYCIIPLQDYLCLGNDARMNTPSTTGGNWMWRVPDGALTQELSAEIAKMTKLYGRSMK